MWSFSFTVLAIIARKKFKERYSVSMKKKTGTCMYAIYDKLQKVAMTTVIY